MIRQPADAFDSFNVHLHGITPEKVAGAPNWPSVLEELLRFADGAPFVAHNAPFDMGVIREACDASGLEWPSANYACTLGISRQVWPGLRSYSLPFVCAELGIEGPGSHHDALHDAHLAASLLTAALRELDSPDLPTLLDCVLLRLGEMSPGQWYGSTRRQLTVREVIEATDDSHVDPDSVFYGKTVVFTGELAMVRRIAWQLVARVGGKPAAGVTKETDYLVCGYQDLMKLAHGEMRSAKFRKAEALQADGQALEILTEKDLFQML